MNIPFSLLNEYLKNKKSKETLEQLPLYIDVYFDEEPQEEQNDSSIIIDII
jgi:hypothetical protein